MIVYNVNYFFNENKKIIKLKSNYNSKIVFYSENLALTEKRLRTIL